MDTGTLTLADFLLARIAADERAARALAEHDRRPVLSLAMTVNHPERILAECEAKRRIVEQVSDVKWAGYAVRDVILGYLALPYTDHPDYRDDWRP